MLEIQQPRHNRIGNAGRPPGNAAAAVVDEADVPSAPPAPVKSWHELVREQDRERFDSAP
jgi:hypothetical protein